jgi:hypothetical protein
MFCESCGGEIASSSKFCGSCGARVEKRQTDATVGTHASEDSNLDDGQNRPKTKFELWWASASNLQKQLLVGSAIGLVVIFLIIKFSAPQVTASVDSCDLGSVTMHNGTSQTQIMQVSVGWFDASGNQIGSSTAQETVAGGATASGNTFEVATVPYSECKVIAIRHF